VQLIDGASGEHHWAKRYDHTFDDLFAVQDEIVRDIVGSLEPALSQIERMRALSRRMEDLGAWEWLQRGLHRLWQQQIRDPIEAEPLLQRAVEAAPDAASCWSALSQCQSMWATQGECDDPLRWLGDAEESARRSIELDPMDYAGHVGLGASLGLRGKTTEAEVALERATYLNPSCAQAWFGLGALSLQPGRQAEAAAYCEKALCLSPRDPMRHYFHGVRAAALLWLEDYGSALVSAEESVASEPSVAFSFRPLLVATLGHLGRVEEARAIRDEILAVVPDFDLAPSRQLAHGELVDRVAEGFRRIGWEPS
jgi:adenylate cyclase